MIFPATICAYIWTLRMRLGFILPVNPKDIPQCPDVTGPINPVTSDVAILFGSINPVKCVGLVACSIIKSSQDARKFKIVPISLENYPSLMTCF